MGIYLTLMIVSQSNLLFKKQKLTSLESLCEDKLRIDISAKNLDKICIFIISLCSLSFPLFFQSCISKTYHT
jgi:hypothetical protein